MVMTSEKSQVLFPGAAPQVTTDLSNNVVLTTVNDLYNWAKMSSLWPLLYGTACCFIEFAAMLGSRFDFDRFGLLPRSSPRTADLIITAGTVTMKMAPALVKLYQQMAEPKYVIAMGACTISGGMFSSDSYTAVRGGGQADPGGCVHSRLPSSSRSDHGCHCQAAQEDRRRGHAGTRPSAANPPLLHG